MSDQTTQEAVQPGQDPVTLQLQDILAAAQCIQLASTRGAFRADELSFIGSIYDTVNKGVRSAMEKARKELASEISIEEPGQLQQQLQQRR